MVSDPTILCTMLPKVSTNIIVHLRMGKPVTNSLAIALEFGRPHKNVLQSLDGLTADSTINRQEFKPVKFTDAKGEQRRMIELTERGALIAMPFIGGRNSRVGQVRLVDAFFAMREQLALQQVNGWDESRAKASTNFQMMSDALLEVRTDDGKATQAHHYSNEAKLINWVMYGRFEGVDRNGMAQADLVMMQKVEARNAIWIARGRTYAERKAALPTYLATLRAKQPRIAQ